MPEIKEPVNEIITTKEETKTCTKIEICAGVVMTSILVFLFINAYAELHILP